MRRNYYKNIIGIVTLFVSNAGIGVKLDYTGLLEEIEYRILKYSELYEGKYFIMFF